MIDVLRIVVDAVSAAALYELGSRVVVGDQRKFGEYQGPPPTDEFLRDVMASGFGPLIDHLGEEEREQAIDVLVAGSRGADPELVCWARESGR